MWEKHCSIDLMNRWARDMKYILGLLMVAGFFGLGWFFWSTPSQYDFAHKKNIVLVDDRNSMMYLTSEASTVGDFLAEQNIAVTPEDEVFPAREAPIFSGSSVYIARQKTVQVSIGKESVAYQTNVFTVGEALEQFQIVLDEDDLVEPGLQTPLSEKNYVQIVRVVISEEKEESKIAFTTEEEEDENLSWRKKEVVQKGEPGILETTVRIARHDGKEVSRKILSKVVVKEPVKELVRQGTLVKVGKSHTGNASWYAYTGTLSAANPWLPMGSYVRVTNTANGKSVIVKINDRGPFGGGRIIDLDKVAFQEIAPLGQGVTHVKMEEITN